MTTILLAIALCGQIPQYGPRAQWGWDGAVYNRTGWGYRRLYGNGYYPPATFTPRAVIVRPPSPWNVAVAEMRAARASRPRSPSPGTLSELQSLADEAASLWAILLEAGPDAKDAAREEYFAARQRLELARIAAARERR